MGVKEQQIGCACMRRVVAMSNSRVLMKTKTNRIEKKRVLKAPREPGVARDQ